FLAEDGIGGELVTGVQTCALPIYCHEARRRGLRREAADSGEATLPEALPQFCVLDHPDHAFCERRFVLRVDKHGRVTDHLRNGRSEERRVGEGGRYRLPAESSKAR